MGNCLKTPTADDISLLHEGRAGSETGDSSENLGPPPPYQEEAPIYHPTPNTARPVTQLTEDEQIRIAQRLGLIQHLPSGVYDGSKKGRECVICMNDFVIGEPIKLLLDFYVSFPKEKTHFVFAVVFFFFLPPSRIGFMEKAGLCTRPGFLGCQLGLAITSGF
ncbi:RING finger protein 11-like isoform X1 [Branchiostoma floridae x Branchiostoma japonicum]